MAVTLTRFPLAILLLPRCCLPRTDEPVVLADARLSSSSWVMLMAGAGDVGGRAVVVDMTRHVPLSKKERASERARNAFTPDPNKQDNSSERRGFIYLACSFDQIRRMQTQRAGGLWISRSAILTASHHPASQSSTCLA